MKSGKDTAKLESTVEDADQYRIEEPKEEEVREDKRTEKIENSHGTEPLPAHLMDTIYAAREYAEAARATNTVRAYDSDVEDFSTYCRVELGGARTLPADPETVALYITDMARDRGLKVSTIERRLASISARHKREGFSSPTEQRLVREVMKGVRRKQGSSQKQAAPLTIGTLRRVLSAMRERDPETGSGKPAVLRDRALLLLGFAGSFRRDELSTLRASDLEFFEGQGLVVLLRSSKTDTAGEGEAVGIPYGKHEATCPVTNLERWLYFSGRTGEEPLFCQIDRHGNIKSGGLSGDGINGVVKRRVQEAGLDSDKYSGHSLRAGLPTSASEAKVGMEAWMPHTRHRSVAVAMRYARRGTLFTNNPTSQVGL